MSDTKRAISELLTKSKLETVVYETLSSMDESEVIALIQGEGRLRFVPNEANGKKQPVTIRRSAIRKRPLPKPSEIAEAQLQADIDETSQKLLDAESRGVAEELIASISYPRRKEFLTRLAKACKVHVDSKDTIATIEMKLIEDIVGAKLSAKAFREVAF